MERAAGASMAVNIKLHSAPNETTPTNRARYRSSTKWMISNATLILAFAFSTSPRRPARVTLGASTD